MIEMLNVYRFVTALTLTSLAGDPLVHVYLCHGPIAVHGVSIHGQLGSLDPVKHIK